MSWEDTISCGHYGGVNNAMRAHVCVCNEKPRHPTDHRCSCTRTWENRALA